MTKSIWRAAGVLTTVALVGGEIWAQTPPPQGQTAASARQQRQAARGAGRPNAGPPAEAPMNVVMVQNMVDAWALVEARKQLDLSEEQYSNFVTRMTRLQGARRKHLMERQRLFRELRPLVLGPGPRRDDLIAEKVKALDDLTQQGAGELRQLGLEVDGVLTPFQRGRFRVFEEQVERQKIDMLLRVRQGRGAPPPAK